MRVFRTKSNLATTAIAVFGTVRRGGVWHFPLYDANGNITAYISESGAVSATYAYGPFGETIAHTGMDFEHRFGTKPYNGELGTYTYIYREYSPTLGRWLSEDPILEQGDFNLYSFCSNEPVGNYDYLGKCVYCSNYKFFTSEKNNQTNNPIIHEFREHHNRHCQTEGDMNKANYEKHFMTTADFIHDVNVRKYFGSEVYMDMAAANCALNKPEKLYGATLEYKFIPHKSSPKQILWHLEIIITDLETCCCPNPFNKCGKITKIHIQTTPFNHYRSEVLP